MLIKTRDNAFIHPIPSEITPAHTYQNWRENRRDMMRLAATGVAGAAMAAWGARDALGQVTQQAAAVVPHPGKLAALASVKSGVAGAVTMEKLTDYKDASTYNNFYEFGTDKADPAKNAHTLKTTPWTVEVEGMVKKPAKYTLEDLLKLRAQEERIYRLRCVEGWSSSVYLAGFLTMPSTSTVQGVVLSVCAFFDGSALSVPNS